MKPALTAERFNSAVRTAASEFNVPGASILGRRRPMPIARARLALYAALYLACETSSTEIAARVDRDHTTVLDGIQRALGRAKIDPEYAAAIDAIMGAAL